MKERIEGLVARFRKLGAFYEEKQFSPLGDTVPTPGTVAIQFADELAAALAAEGQPKFDVHWAIKAECARCRESYPQRHDKPDYIPNFGNVERGDWTHPCTKECDWRFCQAARIHEALHVARAAAPSLHKDKTGWLIECEGPMWMFIRDDHQTAWTTDSLKAVRFARREDAENILFALDLQGLMGACVTEHRWGL